MMKYQAILNTDEIALVEHEIIKSTCILEGNSDCMVNYIAGVHDMAEMLIGVIKNKFPNGGNESSECQF